MIPPASLSILRGPLLIALVKKRKSLYSYYCKDFHLSAVSTFVASLSIVYSLFTLHVNPTLTLLFLDTQSPVWQPLSHPGTPVPPESNSSDSFLRQTALSTDNQCLLTATLGPLRRKFAIFSSNVSGVHRQAMPSSPLPHCPFS